MKICLVSDNAEFRNSCRDVLHELDAVEWQLLERTVRDCPPDADLYIWDDHGRIVPPPDVDQTCSKHLFVVHRGDITPNQDESGSISAAAILLQPVTRACLSAFLGQATSAVQARISKASLRAERDEILQCLIQSNLQIQKYDQDRTNFLARAVHDFRAPLMTASGYCGLLLNEALGPENEQQKEVLRRMQHSINRLSRMASAMFELSVGRRNKSGPQLLRAHIRDCAEQALHEITPLAEAKRIAISVRLDSESGPLHLESGQIEQVLINILENACKFTPRAGEIDVRGYPYFWERRSQRGPRTTPPALDRRREHSREPNAYRVDIRDSGPRIAEDHMAEIFEEYTSYGGGADRSGGGLGLAICKMILAGHGGRIWAENSDAGPRFCFVLPIIREHDADEVASNTYQQAN